MRLILTLGLTLVALSGLSAQTLPTGIFNDNIQTGLSSPCGLAFIEATPTDMRFFVTERASGRIYVCQPSGTRQLVGTVPSVLTGSERGLLGICVDPAFPASPYIYICYSHTAGGMRIGRYTINGVNLGDPNTTAMTLGSFYQVISNIPDSAFNHNGGTVRFGPDGMLYASFGDDANSCAAQTITDGRGVILRMDVSGLPAGAGGPPSIAQLTPASGNPFVGMANFGPITYAYGLRNPFRFNVDAQTGNLYIADVGQNAWEEFDELINPGTNFGWPRFEGNASYQPSCPTSGTLTAPMVAISQSEGWRSVMTFGGRYRNVMGGANNLGSGYEGQVFYTDYYSGTVRRLEWNGTAWVNPAPVSGQPSNNDWARGFNGLCEALVGPDGAIWYVREGAGLVGRVRSDANAPQVTIVSGDNQVGNAGQPLAQPLRIQAVTVGGVPLAGTTIDWTVQGAASVTTATTTTDAAGFTETSVILDGVASTQPRITATVRGTTAAAVFSPIWRGLNVRVISTFVLATFNHSEFNSPLILAVDTPAPSPLVSTPYGDIWTSIFAPGPGFFAIDGFGVFGPLDPTARTPAGSTTWTKVFSGLPPTGGLQLTAQVYAYDTARAGTPEFFVITNKVDVTLP